MGIRPRHRRLVESARLLALLVVVAASWCFAYQKLNRSDWQSPPYYGSDTLLVAGLVKAASAGEYPLFLTKFNSSLNAPFGASWNDFPITEDFLIAFGGLAARVLGVFPALNFLSLLASLLAAASFYLTGRHLRWRWEWCWVAALAFGLSPYVFSRSIHHLTLTYCWHLPLCLLVCWWAASRRGLNFGTGRFWLALAVAIVTGWQNAYYTSWFIELLALSSLSHAVRHGRWIRLIPGASIGAVALAAFISVNLDTITYQALMGSNPGAVIRKYMELEVYALRPVELFLPLHHRLTLLSDLSARYASNLAIPRNENAYLGILGALGLVLMGGSTVFHLMGRKGNISGLALQSLWLFGYSVIGGLNGMIGLIGFKLFRCQNRISVLLLALSLCFIVRSLSHLSRRWPQSLSKTIATLVAVLVLWDQLPLRLSKEKLASTREMLDSDHAFANLMERKVEPGGMIFQLPIILHPEAAVGLRELEYAHLRPYFFTKRLRYSYGAEKGRGYEDWQQNVASLTPVQMISSLEKYGFSAIYIDCIAYPDRGKGLVADLGAAGRNKVLTSRNQDLVCVLLHPEPQHGQPLDAWPSFGDGWYPGETDGQGRQWRWSSVTNPTIRCWNITTGRIERSLSFELDTVVPRFVSLKINGKTLWTGSLKHGTSTPLSSIPVTLLPGQTIFELSTDAPPALGVNGDPRSFVISLRNLRLDFPSESSSRTTPPHQATQSSETPNRKPPAER